MSEFKFACPVCGQHITADSTAAGSKLACPTCFRKIVVPQAPASAETKFVLSASEATKPRATTVSAPSPLSPAPTARRNPAVIALVALLGVLCAAGATFVVLRAKHSPAHHDQAEAEEGSGDESPGIADPGLPATNTLPWTLELADTAYPEGPVTGRIRNRDFICERAILSGGTLTLRRGRSGTTDLGLSIAFFAKQAEELDGKTLSVTATNAISPKLTLRWKDGGQAKTEAFKNGYALKLEFGAINNGRIPGRIYVSAPDAMKSCVAGTFSAEVRKPSPPKPKVTKTN